MPNITYKGRFILTGLCIVIFMFIYSGCHFQRRHAPEEKAFLPDIGKMVVIGFRSAKSPGDEAGVVRSPLSGAVFMSEPVPEDVVTKMTNNLFNRLLEDKSYDLTSPGQARGVFSSLVSSDLALSEIEISRKIGNAFSANTVLIGYIYRWREREGADYAVNNPASVAFDLYLIRANDGAILWKGRFDKTQRSLSENILDMETFLNSGGRWMSAEKLAGFGLGELLEKLPKDESKRKD